MSMISLTPRQVEELRGSVNRTLMDLYAECSDEWAPDYPHKQTETCRENGRITGILQRVREKLDEATRDY